MIAKIAQKLLAKETDMSNVFNADINIGAAALKQRFNLDENKLLVRKSFHTFQGEAPYSGESAVFLRLGGCDRGLKQESCRFCDTDFAVDKSTVMSVDEVAAKIRSLRLPSTELLVITGGEPLLQQHALHKLLHKLLEIKNERNLVVQIETNGDVTIDKDFRKMCQIVCSPKAWEMKNPWKSLNPDNFPLISYFRHLLTANAASPYHSVCKSILDYCKKEERSIYLSPITVYKKGAKVEDIDKGWAGNAIDKESTLSNYRYAAQYATELLKQGIYARLSSQSHLMFGVE